MIMTSNMLLPVPEFLDVGVLYSENLKTCFGLVDAHDHTPGKGTPILSDSLKITDNWSFNGFSAFNLSSVSMLNSEQRTINTGYVSGGDLFFLDGFGREIQLTSDGAINATSLGGIGGGYVGSDADVVYDDTDKVFIFTQDAGVPASLSVGPVQLRSTGVNANFVSLLASPALSASNQIILPDAPPASDKILSLSPSGEVGYLEPDAATTEVFSGSLRVVPDSVTNDKFKVNVITPIKRRFTYAVSESCGTFTTTSTDWVNVPNLSVTTDIRPGSSVMVLLQPDGSVTQPGFVYVSQSNSTTNPGAIRCVKSPVTQGFGSSGFGWVHWGTDTRTISATYPPSILFYAGVLLDPVPFPGPPISHTFTVSVSKGTGSATVGVVNCRLVVVGIA